MWEFASIAVVSIIFFALFPGFGAFYVRRRWRIFRRRMIDSSLLPQVEYEQIGREPDGFLGSYRFSGELGAIQGDDTIWINSDTVSLSAELSGVSVYLLPSFSYAENEGVLERNEESLPDEMPRQVPWNRIFTLPEGTKVYISGRLYAERGHGVFRAERHNPLTVVIFDGDEETMLRRSIWGGRQRNEYWNQFTPVSLIAGSLGLLFLAYNFYRYSDSLVPALLSLTISMSPIIPLLPPGLVLFFIYRYLWKRGRFNRAERDMLRLPLRYFGDVPLRNGITAPLPDGTRYGLRIFDNRSDALRAMKEKKIRILQYRRTPVPQSYYVFGEPIPGADPEIIGRPNDPMAELIMIPGNPTDLILFCQHRARANELLSVGAFILSYMVNWLVVTYALNNLIV